VNKNIVLGLGGLAVIVVSVLSISKTLSPQELQSCTTEILEVTNNINFAQTMLLAPPNILATLKSSLQDRTLSDGASLIIAGGINPTENGKSMIFVKTFIEVKDDSLASKETRENLMKGKNNCQLLGKEYEIYTGSALM